MCVVNGHFGGDRLVASINHIGDVGSFVFEYMAYHVAWYRDHTMDLAAARRCLVGSHRHVGIDVDLGDGAIGVALQLGELINVLPPRSLA